MFTHVPNYPQIEKIETGIGGFDLISSGGLPKGRTTLVSGAAGILDIGSPESLVDT
jgi:predicted ATP-dependent serine protease